MSFLNWLLVAAVFVIIGFISGALVTLWWVEREKAPAQERPRKASATAPIPTQPAHAEPAAAEPQAVPAFAPPQAPDSAPRPPTAPPDVLPPQPPTNVRPERAPALDQKPTSPPPTSARPERMPAEGQKPAPPLPRPLSLLSIVEQIDQIFQEMLASSELAGQPIRLMEDPVKGVMVRIGSEQYNGVDAVPDPQVSALIRKAVMEWEKQAGESRS